MELVSVLRSNMRRIAYYKRQSGLTRHLQVATANNVSSVLYLVLRSEKNARDQRGELRIVQKNALRTQHQPIFKLVGVRDLNYCTATDVELIAGEFDRGCLTQLLTQCLRAIISVTLSH